MKTSHIPPDDSEDDESLSDKTQHYDPGDLTASYSGNTQRTDNKAEDKNFQDGHKTIGASANHIQDILSTQSHESKSISITPVDSVERFADLMSITEQVAAIGGWELDPAEEAMQWTPGLFMILGREPEDGPILLSEFINMVDPADKTVLEDAIAGALERNGSFTCRCKIIRRDLSSRYVKIEGACIAGRGVMAGYVHDITDQKDYTEKLEFASKIFSYTIEGLMITDTSTVIHFINPAFTKITGYTPGEIIGQKANVLSSKHHDDDFYKDMWRSLITKGAWQGEIWNRHKNGDAYLAWLSITSVKSVKGQTLQYVGVLYDKSEVLKDQGASFQSYRDALTSLPNRNLFYDRLTHATNHAGRHKEKLAVMKINIESLEEVNSEISHAAGDILLQDIAGAMGALLRDEDTVARLGGGEFMILVERWEDDWGENIVLSRIRERFSKPFDIMGESLEIKATIGMAIFPDDGKEASVLIDIAESR